MQHRSHPSRPTSLQRVIASSHLARRAAALGVTLLLGCAGSNAKQAPLRGEGGEGGGGVSADAGASTNAAAVDEAGSGGGGALAQGGASDGTMAGAPSTDDPETTDDSGGAAGMGGTLGGGGAAGSNDAAGSSGASGAAGDDGGPPIPTSVCGPGKWFPGEGPCLECPASQQTFELECADYVGAQILLTTTGQLQYVFASLPSGVQAHEGSPVELPITYLSPDESHVRLLRFNGGAWSVDLRQAPAPPQTLIVPPFSTADVCGDVFHSREPVRFERVVGQAATSYAKICP